MKFWTKIALFLSAYLPLFFILTVKTYPNDKWTLPYEILTYLFIAIVIVSIIVWALIFHDFKKNPGEIYEILEIQNRTHESLNYLAPYLVAFLSFDFGRWQDITVLITFLVIIFMVYITSDLIYTNPLLASCGYRFYRVEICKPRDCESSKKRVLLISKDDRIKINSKINLKCIGKGVFMK